MNPVKTAFHESTDEMLFSCNLELLNDRINNLGIGLLGMPENGTMKVNKAFLTAVHNYMCELLGLRRKMEESK
ncbi:MAG: hypothetical protein PHX61_08145 [Alphaproteobacteria bacterium]|nr:hypothetical protein [Alphaproteobacteria bacterium]